VRVRTFLSQKPNFKRLTLSLRIAPQLLQVHRKCTNSLHDNKFHSRFVSHKEEVPAAFKMPISRHYPHNKTTTHLAAIAQQIIPPFPFPTSHIMRAAAMNPQARNESRASTNTQRKAPSFIFSFRRRAAFLLFRLQGVMSNAILWALIAAAGLRPYISVGRWPKRGMHSQRVPFWRQKVRQMMVALAFFLLAGRSFQSAAGQSIFFLSRNDLRESSAQNG
jgi:hypothetical protein